MNNTVKFVNVGVVGLGQRGNVIIDNLFACDEAKIVAVCDAYEDRCDTQVKKIKDKKNIDAKAYLDYKELINDKDVEVVIICAAWESHVEIAIESMKIGKAVGLEVGGAYSIEDCYKLVDTYEETKTPFFFMENCCWDRFELLSTSLVRNGVLGEIVYCHGAYSHDLRDEILGGNVNRHYRLRNYISRNCDNYPTHELGPIAKILNINRGNRMVSLCSMASKSAGLEAFETNPKNPDKSLVGQKFMQADIVNTLIKCENGELISLTLDTTLPKYYSREFTVRGTKGLAMQETNMVMLEEKNDSHEFFDPEKTIEKYLNNANDYSNYLTSEWENITEEKRKLGHGGMDYFMLEAFLHAYINKEEMPIDVYDAASWMAITALSAISISSNGASVEVPDFTRGKYKNRSLKDVTLIPKVGDNRD